MDPRLQEFLNELDASGDASDVACVRDLIGGYSRDYPCQAAHDVFCAIDNAADSGTYTDPAALVAVLRRYHAYDGSHLR